MDADTSTWTLLAGFNRWALYALMLISSGSALFALLTPAPIPVKEAAARLGKITSILGAFSFLATVGLGGAEIMTGGPEVLAAFATWEMGASTSLGQSAAFGVFAMLILWCGHAWRQSVFLTLGALAAIGSFLLTGHAATASPTWLAVPAVALHLVGAAYWIGALYPLQRALRILDPASAAAVVIAFSQRAIGFVAAIAVTGLVISGIQLRAIGALVTTSYGYRLDAKVGLFVVLLALAAYNKVVLTPLIIAGKPDGMDRLRRVIGVEYLLILLILGAAVSLTLTEPPRALRQDVHAQSFSLEIHNT